MLSELIKQLFFIPELIEDLQHPLRGKYFHKYIKRYLQGLFWLIKYGYPSRSLKLIGITGTDGKTTTANLIFSILEKAQKKVSIVSTIYGKVGDEVFDTGFHVTTPRPKALQSYFSKAVKEGSEYFILEATSHGLDQYRLLGCNFEVGILTNITHEHLDYHKTFDNYFQTKAKLFKRSKLCILNIDDSSFEKMKKRTRGKLVTYGLSKVADVNPLNFSFRTTLPGEYNKYNILAAVACAKAIGIDERVIKEAIAEFKELSGRMEEIKNTRGIKIFVDFAHTPNALEGVLKTLKEGRGRLISVFGAAAERDIEKRPVMGRLSAELADITILTDEDPRFENREKIIEEIAGGALKAGAKEGITLFREPDRYKAIKLALSFAKKGDVVGIFGKGHEKSMNYSGVEKLWSDQSAVRKIVKVSK